MQLRKRHLKSGYLHARKCYYCGTRITRENKSIDHVVPLSRNGGHHKTNKVLSCRPCNGRKAAMDVEEFRTMLERERHRPVRFWGEVN